MDLALSSVDELYVGDEKLIAAVNTWTGVYDYALIVSRSNKNKRGIKDKIWLRCDRDDNRWYWRAKETGR